jgi:hypothetical protein
MREHVNSVAYTGSLFSPSSRPNPYHFRLVNSGYSWYTVGTSKSDEDHFHRPIPIDAHDGFCRRTHEIYLAG